MQKFSKDTVAEVLAANDIVDVIGASLELKPAGSGRFKALCPFHSEKTPSFHVNRDRQAFYCFGCEKGGDALGFIMNLEGLTFVEALRKLADRAGIRLPAANERDNRDDFVRTQLLEFGKFAAKFYKDTLNDPLRGGKGRTYLKTRTLTPETVARFGLGYAPEGWSNLTEAAQKAGFKDGLIEISGLARRGDRGGMYDFFRNRLMVPIRDASGNVVAFGGRDLGDDAAKYINSPENPVYKKGRVLYGLHEGRDALRKEKRAILVEGYFDLLRCHDAGVCNVVATCGTALTPEQAGLIRRYVPEVVVVYDGDAAGIRAAMRGIAILVGAGLAVRALTLPDGNDPDDYVKAHGADAFQSLVENALDFVTFYAQMSADRAKTIEGRSDVAKEIFAILLGVSDELRRDEYLKRTARELRLNEWTVRSEFAKVLKQKDAHDSVQVQEPAGVRVTLSQDDCDFVAILLNSEPMRERVRKDLGVVALQPSPLAEVLTQLMGSAGISAGQDLESEDAQRLYWAAAASDREIPYDKAESLVDKRVRRLVRESLSLELGDTQAALEQAERQKDMPKAVELLTKKMAIKRRIEELGAA
ncbi:MAG: DNA primase [Candidatus Hydrogenedentes bacterium]|nr:DNA primase [Candidatus Hydrogenedentota bacterium]